jgi:hypothetical protein
MKVHTSGGTVYPMSVAGDVETPLAIEGYGNYFLSLGQGSFQLSRAQARGSEVGVSA